MRYFTSHNGTINGKSESEKNQDNPCVKERRLGEQIGRGEVYDYFG